LKKADLKVGLYVHWFVANFEPQPSNFL